jgi:tRNA A37 threonylcarbamoyladenosine modification protein TsaB
MLTPQEREDAREVLDNLAVNAGKAIGSRIGSMTEDALNRLVIAVCVLAEIALKAGPGSEA